MNRHLLIVFLLIFIAGMANSSPSNEGIEGKVTVNQTSSLNQSQICYGSTSSSDVNINTTTINQRPFPIGAQPQIPAYAPGYGGPWKEGWNIISTDMYKLLETFWPVREAREAVKGGGKIRSLYWEIPYRGSSILLPSAGVNVTFEIDKETSPPASAIPIGIVVVKGDEKTTLWHLIAKAVIEASRRGASWLNIELYNYNPGIKSSSWGLGLATTGAGINTAGDLSAVSGGGTGWASAKAGPITEPFIHCVAYVLPSALKKEVKREEIKREIVQPEIIPPQRPKIEFKPPEKQEAFKMVARIHPDPEKKVIYVRLKNVTQERVYVSPIYFRLETQNNQTISMSTDTYTYPSRFWARRLEPGEEASGYLVFKTDEPMKRLIYDDQSERAPVFSNL